MWISNFVKYLLPYKDRIDYCTLFPDGNWGDCCEQHDDDYKYGEIPKKEADLYMRECIIASDHPIIAEVMYNGVSIFGWIPWWNHRRRNLQREDVEMCNNVPDEYDKPLDEKYGPPEKPVMKVMFSINGLWKFLKNKKKKKTVRSNENNER